MKEHFKVLHIITLSEIGGAQQVCHDIVTNLEKTQYTIEVACAPGGELISRLKKHNIVVHIVDFLKREISPLNDLKALFVLYRIIRKGRYDIVHCHSTKAGLLGRIAAWLAKTPRIYFTVHGWSFYNVGEYGRIKHLLIFFEKILAKLTDMIICVSINDKIEGMNKKIAYENKFTVIHNGISSSQAYTKGILRDEIDANEIDVIFGLVARLAYPKNPLFLLKVAKQITKSYKQAKFVLIGDGPLYDECREFVNINNLGENVFLLGLRKNARSFLIDMDVFVLTSQFESLPLTIIEAMFAKLPIIATNVGGVSELVQNERNGFLVSPNNGIELAERMKDLIRNAEKRTQMGKESQKIAIDNYTLDKMIQKYDKLYQVDILK